MKTNRLEPEVTAIQAQQVALNPSQRQAVEQPYGNLLVIAGAGSGKTRVITARIAHLIAHAQVDPRSIVALTFTNKAAQEMKERIVTMLGGLPAMPMVTTFHAYCLYLLRTNAHLLPYSTFSIMDADDQQTLIKKLVKSHSDSKQINISNVCHQLSTYKNKLYAQEPTDDLLTPLLKEIYLAYEAEKKMAHCFDFDDLIIQVLKLFREQQEFKNRYHQKVRHILVDEYQDTSKIQHELLKCMTLEQGECVVDSVCAVGDEDQSIYSWRGANVANMRDFMHDFDPVQLVKIEQNYRSVQPILKTANTLIANNTSRTPKELWSTKEANGRIILGTCRSDEQEAEVIAQAIKAMPTETSRREIAILYRTHHQSRAIEEAMIRHGIAYRIIGGIRFYERKEIKDLLAYLRILANPFDRMSVHRAINCPPRGLGDKFIEMLFQAWDTEPLLDIFGLLAHLQPTISVTYQNRVQQFLDVFQGLSLSSDPSHALRSMVDRLGYIGYLYDHYEKPEAQDKEDNVRELLQSVYTFTTTLGTTPQELNLPPLIQLLERIALLQEEADELGGEQIQMMSLHAAKGLEFETVFITGLEDGIIPSTRSMHNPEALAEERRLLYVGITRAKEHLVLLYSLSRTLFGQHQLQTASRFVDELEQKLVTPIDFARKTNADILSLFKAWHRGTPITVFASSTQQAAPAPRPTTYTASRAATATAQPTSGSSSSFPKNSRVMHSNFGVGIVLSSEPSGSNVAVTALFAAGKKTVLSNFLRKLADR